MSYRDLDWALFGFAFSGVVYPAALLFLRWLAKRRFVLALAADRFDDLALWDALPWDGQDEIGQAALNLALCCAGSDRHDNRRLLFGRSENLAWASLQRAFGKHASEALERSPLPLPPAKLFARSCRICGCTDDRACKGGCHWIDRDLCSACAPKAAQS